MAAKRKGLAVKVLLPAAAIGAVVAVVALTVVWALDSPAAGPPMAAGLAAVVLAMSGAGWWLIRRQVTGPLTRLRISLSTQAQAEWGQLARAEVRPGYAPHLAGPRPGVRRRVLVFVQGTLRCQPEQVGGGRFR